MCWQFTLCVALRPYVSLSRFGECAVTRIHWWTNGELSLTSRKTRIHGSRSRPHILQRLQKREHITRRYKYKGYKKHGEHIQGNCLKPICRKEIHSNWFQRSYSGSWRDQHGHWPYRKRCSSAARTRSRPLCRRIKSVSSVPGIYCFLIKSRPRPLLLPKSETMRFLSYFERKSGRDNEPGIQTGDFD